MPPFARRVGKPHPGVPIDRSHPLAQGLAGFWPLNEGFGAPVDAATGIVTTNSGPTWTGTPSGGGLTFNGAGNYLALGIPPTGAGAGLNFSTPASWAMLGAPTPGLVNQHWFDIRSAGGVGYFLAFNFNGNNEMNVNTTAVSAANMVDGNWHTYGISWFAGNAVQSYRDGAFLQTSNITQPSYAGQTSEPFFGGKAAVASLGGPVAWFAAWSRPLSANDHVMLATNPWALFVAPSFGISRHVPSVARARRSLSARAGTRGAM